MSQEAVAKLRAAYDGFARQDMAAVLAAFDERIEWTVPDVLPFGGVYRGHEGVGGFFAQLPGYFEQLIVEPQEFFDGGEVITVTIRLRGKGPGGSLDSQSLHLWRMGDGKAASFREYPDTAALLQVIGHAAPPADGG